MDPEDPEAKGFEFNDQSVRKGFIRKVFSILTVSDELNSTKKNISLLSVDFWPPIISSHNFITNFFFQLQLLVTLGVICLFVFHEPTMRWVQRNSWLWWTSMIVLIVTLLVLACCENMRRKAPGNFILLFLFTAAMSFMMGVMSANFEIFEVLLAIGVRQKFMKLNFRTPVNISCCR
jgi:FtsH-binding integral membrane protein